MPLAKLTCPKCHATLKPAKPVPEGKTVKCPKCEETFKAGAKSAEDKAEAPAKKPAAAAAAADDDDDGAGTYAVIKDEAEEKKKADKEDREERKKRKRKRIRAGEMDEDDEDEDEDEEEDVGDQYLKNFAQRDPRGPAQEAIVGPANWLLRTALLGFFGWVFAFGAFMLPVAFPNIENKEAASQLAPAEKDKAKGKKQAQHWWSAETILKEDNTPWSVLAFVFVLILGVAQAGALGIASVKMQSLESYNWSLCGCILAIIPLVTFPLFVFITYVLDLFDWLIEMGMDETCWMFALVAFAWGPIVGGICLKQFLQPQVRPGFEYHPE